MRGADQEAGVIHGLRLHEGGGARLQGDGGCCSFVSSGTASGGLSSSTTSSLTDDDDAASSPPGRRPVSSSSSSSSSTSSMTSSSDKMQTGGAAAAGPLYELSTMLDHLPALRKGLSKYYRGRSQSFTSLAKVSCAEDLAKKTTPCLRRTKASRCYAAVLGAKNRWSKKVAKSKKRCRGVHLTTYCRKLGAQASCAAAPDHLPNHSKREVHKC